MNGSMHFLRIVLLVSLRYKKISKTISLVRYSVNKSLHRMC